MPNIHTPLEMELLDSVTQVSKIKEPTRLPDITLSQVVLAQTFNTVAQQPTSVCVDASTWQNYQSGIFSNCGTQIDHCVLAVGYVEGSYWYIQNQWTTSWGEKGFIQLAWGNTCAVCQQAQIPTVPTN